MFVYFLRDATRPVFKIGKANDIHQRIAALGGPEQYDLHTSKCIRLPTERDALRVEKALQRLFIRWNVTPNEAARVGGDTEIFEATCFDRVLRFVHDNPDLPGRRAVDGPRRAHRSCPQESPCQPLSCTSIAN